MEFRDVKQVTQSHTAFIKEVESVQSGLLAAKFGLLLNTLERVLPHTTDGPIHAQAGSCWVEWDLEPHCRETVG